MSARHDAWKQRAVDALVNAGCNRSSLDRSIATIERVCAQEQDRMRRAAKIDGNQNEIVDALRAVGAQVAVTSAVGNGFPDLVVGYMHKGVRRVYMIEIKDGELPPSARKLTPEQARFHREWFGYCWLANSVSDALAIIGLGPKSAA